jgi:hypothetical protein
VVYGSLRRSPKMETMLPGNLLNAALVG